MSHHQPPVTAVTPARNSVATPGTTSRRNGPYVYRAVAAPGGPGIGSRYTAEPLPLVNPFYERASQRLIERGPLGGQYVSPPTDRPTDRPRGGANRLGGIRGRAATPGSRERRRAVLTGGG